MNRRNFVKAVGATGALATMGGVASARRPGPTIVEAASGDDRFETLVAAVVEAGLEDTLSGNRQLTVFAPTDEAFENIGISVDGEGSLDIAPGTLQLLDDAGLSLADVLTYHVSPGRRNAESVTTSDELPTLYGELIQVDGTELNGGQAEITDPNIECSNGIIHAIGATDDGDGVLLP